MGQIKNIKLHIVTDIKRSIRILSSASTLSSTTSTCLVSLFVNVRVSFPCCPQPHEQWQPKVTQVLVLVKVVVLVVASVKQEEQWVSEKLQKKSGTSTNRRKRSCRSLKNRKRRKMLRRNEDIAVNALNNELLCCCVYIEFLLHMIYRFLL